MTVVKKKTTTTTKKMIPAKRNQPRFPLVTDEIIPTLMSPFFESIPDQGPHFFTVDKWPFGGKI
jgi:hypothetical protein